MLATAELEAQTIKTPMLLLRGFANAESRAPPHGKRTSERVRLVLAFNHRGERSKNFLLRDAHVRLDPSENGWAYEVPHVTEAGTAGHGRSAFVSTNLDVVENAFIWRSETTGPMLVPGSCGSPRRIAAARVSAATTIWS